MGHGEKTVDQESGMKAMKEFPYGVMPAHFSLSIGSADTLVRTDICRGNHLISEVSELLFNPIMDCGWCREWDFIGAIYE